MLKKLILILSVFVACVLISQVQAISNIIITPNSFTVPTNQEVASYNATTGITTFRNVTGSSSVSTSNVVDIYDQKITDYTTPTSAYASSFQHTPGTTPVGFDTISSSHDTSGVRSSSSTSITVANNNNRAIVAILLTDESTPVTSVTGSANSFTKISENTNGVITTSEWITLNPNTGSNTITMNYASQTNQFVMVLYSLYNVDQVTGYDTSNVKSNQGTSGNPSTNITPDFVNSLILDGSANTGTLSNPSQTSGVMDNTETAIKGGSQYKENLSNTNTLTFSYTASGGSVWNQIICEIISKGPSYPASNSTDNNLITEWRSKVTSHPWLVLDTGSSQILSALSIYPDVTNTNSTQLLLQTSSDNSTWTTKRTVNISLLTNATWNFVRWDLDNQTMRWVRIYDNSSSNVQLSLLEVKALEPSSTTLLLRHGHKVISASDGTLPLNS